MLVKDRRTSARSVGVVASGDAVKLVVGEAMSANDLAALAEIALEAINGLGEGMRMHRLHRPEHEERNETDITPLNKKGNNPHAGTRRNAEGIKGGKSAIKAVAKVEGEWENVEQGRRKGGSVHWR